MIDKEEILFPYPDIRKIQDEMISEVTNALTNKKNLIIHAPTGIGKTIAVLGPSLSYAFKKKLTVFFLTSRHTQHHLVVNTLKQIKKRYDKEIISCDIIGKQWMCGQPGVETLYSSEFNEYCKSLREGSKCEFYSSTKNKTGKATVKAGFILEKIKRICPCHTEDSIDFCRQEKLCPYEMSVLIGKEAAIIIADYYYIFNPAIRDAFLQKIGRELANVIIIIDEGHNLPKRCRDLLTNKLSNFTLQRAAQEAKKFGSDEMRAILEEMKNIFIDFYNTLGENQEEKYISKKEFIDKIKKITDYEQLIADLEFISDEIREKQRQSYIGAVASFLSAWEGQDKGYARYLTAAEAKKEPLITLYYRCLDPSLVTKDVVNNTHSTIIMSGTLTPTNMYKDIIGFENSVEAVYSSPFPKKNRLALIIPETTTKFTRRNEDEYRRIAEKIAELANLIPGNCALFFPSYYLRDSVYKFFNPLCKKTIFVEKPRLTKTEKQELLEEFKGYKDKGAVLLGVATGSFGEGIDLPGDLLKAVIVVGLPLEKPNLETKELIEYYDGLFGKGWDYGYIFPAITKILQNAGRCIRSETDRGVIIFLDERYAWPNYKRCFPPDMDVKITKLYSERIKEFFNL